MPESVLTQTMPLLAAGGACCVAEGLAEAAGVAAGAGVGAVDGGGVVVLAAGAGDGVAAGAAGVVEATGAELSAVVFLDLEDFLAEEVSAAAVEESAVSVFLEAEVFLLDEESVAAEVSAVSGFLDLEDFLEEEVSAAAVAESAVAVFLDFAEALLEAEVSAELSPASDFLLLEDFFAEVEELSADWSPSEFLDLEDVDFDEVDEPVEASSVVFFFLLDFFVVSVWLWSEDCDVCEMAAALSARLPANRNRAGKTAKNGALRRRRVILGCSFRPDGCAHLVCTRAMCGRAGNRRRESKLRGDFPVGNGRMMKENRGEVKNVYGQGAD